MLKKILLYPFIYFVSCAVWAGQVVGFFLVWDGVFSGVGYDISKIAMMSFVAALFAMLVIGLPFFLLLTFGFKKAQLQEQKHYIFAAMFLAFCVPAIILLYLDLAQSWDIAEFWWNCVASMFMGILSGISYYQLQKKFFDSI